MRGNSGFLRWLPSGTRSAALLAIAAALALFWAPAPTHAGPVSGRHRRMMREVYTEFESNNQTEIQPEAGTCILNGLQVSETTANCEKKPGCRVIQKTGYCCPDYQCECERDGKIYSNGEKLVDPDTPCKVCYCQGGEITCNNVNCYERSDCEPKYIPGRCCPVYDNCPPLERKPSGSKETSTEISQLSSTPPSPSADPVSSPTPSTVKPEAANNNPLGIKIKEITKPEEIRIIDEKPKQIYPITKPGENNGGAQVKVSSSSKETQHGNSVEIGNQPQVVPPAAIVNSAESKTSKDSATSETANKLETADVNTINDEDSQKTVRHTSSLANKDESVENSEESSSVEDKKPAASQLGKEVVIVDHNGNSKPITVFGIEGLQRGDVQSDMGYESNSTSSEKDDDKTNIPDLEIAASNDNSVKVLPLDPNPGVSTTEGSAVDGKVAFDTILYTAGPDSPEIAEAPEEPFNLTGIAFDTVLHEEGTGPISVSTEGPKSHEVRPHVEDYGTTSERNPAYPTIDDDLSNYGQDEINQQAEDYPEGSPKGKSALQSDEPHVPGSVVVTTEGVGKISSPPQLEQKEQSTTEGINGVNISDIFTDPIKGKESAPVETTDPSTDDAEDSNWSDDLDVPGSGSGFGQLKNSSNLDDVEEISSGAAPLSLEILNDEPHPEEDSIAQPGAIIVSPERNPFEESMHKAIESINSFRKGYVLVF